jgi:hypothetical protein
MYILSFADFATLQSVSPTHALNTSSVVMSINKHKKHITLSQERVQLPWNKCKK